LSAYPPSLETLVEQFAKLPGVGRKSAQRYAFAVMGLPPGEAEAFAESIAHARRSIRRCKLCRNLTDTETCALCASPDRDAATVCVVAEPQDVEALERAREYRGLYHVLHGVIAPSRGIGPRELGADRLAERVRKGGVREVIMALNPDTEGETTALYLARLLREVEGVRVTRLAYGIPMGAHLKFADEVTLARSLEGRREL
jgi:recombination protein RecR